MSTYHEDAGCDCCGELVPLCDDGWCAACGLRYAVNGYAFHFLLRLIESGIAPLDIEMAIERKVNERSNFDGIQTVDDVELVDGELVVSMNPAG